MRVRLSLVLMTTVVTRPVSTKQLSIGYFETKKPVLTTTGRGIPVVDQRVFS